MAKIILLLTYILLGSCADAWSAAYFGDNNGNTLSVTSPTDTQTLGWDYEDRLVSYGDLQTSSTYDYDPEGIKRGATVNGIQTKYLLDHNQDFTQVLEERDSTNNLTTAYTFGNDLLAQDRAGTTSNYLYDALGSVRALSDSNGSVSDSYVYEAFGTLASQTGATPNTYLYTGEQYEAESGLYNLRARRYQPGAGRFLSRDTQEFSNRYVREIGRYSYGANNPVMYVDLSGQSILSEYLFNQYQSIKTNVITGASLIGQTAFFYYQFIASKINFINTGFFGQGLDKISKVTVNGIKYLTWQSQLKGGIEGGKFFASKLTMKQMSIGQIEKTWDGLLVMLRYDSGNGVTVQVTNLVAKTVEKIRFQSLN